MATKKVTSAPLQMPSKNPSTSIAVKKPTSSALVSLKEQMARDLEVLKGKTLPATGNAIRIGQDKMFTLPDGTKTPGPIDLVVVDFCTTHALYPGAFDPKNIVPPVCFAIGDNPGSMVPSANSPELQSEGCTACPMNQFNTAATGGGKACKNARKLAVLPPDSTMDTPIWTLSVSATALKGFDGLVNSVARQFQVPPYGVVVSVSFDPNQTYASLVFGDPRPNENVEIAYARRVEAAEMLAVEPDVSSYVPVVKKPLPARRK
jgi:hypothetical protein